MLPSLARRSRHYWIPAVNGQELALRRLIVGLTRRRDTYFGADAGLPRMQYIYIYNYNNMYNIYMHFILNNTYICVFIYWWYTYMHFRWMDERMRWPLGHSWWLIGAGTLRLIEYFFLFLFSIWTDKDTCIYNIFWSGKYGL